jgi:hypothetical protein
MSEQEKEEILSDAPQKTIQNYRLFQLDPKE